MSDPKCESCKHFKAGMFGAEDGECTNPSMQIYYSSGGRIRDYSMTYAHATCSQHSSCTRPNDKLDRVRDEIRDRKKSLSLFIESNEEHLSRLKEEEQKDWGRIEFIEKELLKPKAILRELDSFVEIIDRIAKEDHD